MMRPLLLLLGACTVMAGITSTTALTGGSDRSEESADRGRALHGKSKGSGDNPAKGKGNGCPGNFHLPRGCDYSPGQIVSYEDAEACTVSACRKMARTCTVQRRPLLTPRSLV